MNSVIKSSVSGLYYVQGKGFAGSPGQATTFDSVFKALQVSDCAAKMGLGDSVVCDAPVAEPVIAQPVDGVSFAVNYVRKQDANGGVKHNDLNPSVRRFRTRDEADHHARRFMKIEKHTGYWISETRDPVNAYVNPVTGKTNPVIGRGRTNR